MSDGVRRGWRPSLNQKIVAVLVLLIVWTVVAGRWSDKGCDLVPQSYGLALTRGAPERWEGCEVEPGGPEYTDEYDRWGG